MGKNLLLWLIIAAVLLTVFNNFSGVSEPQEVSYSEFVEQVNRNEIRKVEFDGQNEYLTVHRKDTSRFKVIIPAPDPKLLDDLMEHDVEVVGKEAETEGFWAQLLIASFPILIIIAVFMLFMRQMQGGVGGRGGPMALSLIHI